MREKLVKDLVILTLAFGALFFAFLGNRPLAAPDEGRYVEIPREMVETGDYLTPRLNGLKYFEKPPLLYWIQTIPIHLFGIKEWAMRLPLAFLALFGCLMTYLFGRRLFDRSTGLWGAIILSTSLLYYVMGRLITLDLGVSIFLSGTLFSFITATQSYGRSRRLWMYSAAVFSALALLSKGLIGLVIPGMIVFCWLFLTRNWGLLKDLFLPSSFLIFLGVAAPWHILVSLKNPGFFDFYFIHEHFERFLTKVHRRHQPLWFFLPVILLGTLPWASFLPRALKRFFTKKDPLKLFFLLWAIIPFIFFSVSSSKLIPYILPIFPALALMMGYHIAKARSLKGEIFGYSFLCLALMGGGTLALIKLDPTLKEILRPHLALLYTILGLSAAGLPFIRLLKGQTQALRGIIVSGVAFLLVLAHAAPHIPRLSIKPLAERFLNTMPKETKVFTYIGYYQDLPPYLGRTVQIVHWHGELLFGSKAEPHQTQIVDYGDFEKAWKSESYVCVFCRQDRYRDLLGNGWFTPTLLGEHQGQMLACNRVPKT